LLDRVREAIRLKRYSLRIEQPYIDWIKWFIVFHGKRLGEILRLAREAVFGRFNHFIEQIDPWKFAMS
jgi:Phage integrase, N-terminal SAM-like domain